MSTKETQFNTHIKPHLRSAYNFTRWICWNKEEADDVYQEAMIRILENLHTIKSNNTKSWIFSIIHNTHIDRIRKSKHKVQEEFSDSTPIEGNSSPGTPELALIKHADEVFVQRLLSELPVEFREVIVLKEFEDMSYAEIAKIIGIPIGTVMSRISRAREKLWSLAREKANEGEKS